MSQTHNAFTHAYQMSKLFWCADDNHWDKLFESPKNPTSRKRKIKSISRPMNDVELEEMEKIKAKYNL